MFKKVKRCYKNRKVVLNCEKGVTLSEEVFSTANGMFSKVKEVL